MVCLTRAFNHGLIFVNGSSCTSLFRGRKRQSMILFSLRMTFQGKRETLQSYIDCFVQVVIKVEGAREKVLDLWERLSAWWPLTAHDWRKKVKTIQEILSMAQSYMILEDILNMCFNNPAFVGTNFIRWSGKESYWWRDDYNRSMHLWYDN